MANMPLSPVERPASEMDYQPISGVAVAAIVVSGIYVLTVSIVAGFALYTHKPSLTMSWLFLAGLGLVLSIAARIHIRRSEGTRTGLKLANVAWWLSVLGGTTYGAYLYASNLALDKQSEKTALEWFDLLKKQKFDQGYLQILDPTRRQGVNADNKAELEAQFGAGSLPKYRNSELVRFFQRGVDEVDVVSLGVRSREQIKEGYQVDCSFLLKSAEGTFEANMVLIGVEGENIVGREWFIPNPEIALTPKTITTYGRLYMELNGDALKFSQKWVESLMNRTPDLAYIDTLPQSERPPLLDFVNSKRALASQLAGGGLVSSRLPAGMIAPKIDPTNKEAAAADLQARNFFLIEGVALPTEEKKKKFLDAWKQGFLLNAGTTRLQNTDTISRLTIAPQEIQFSYPVEIGLPTSPVTFAKARVVVVSTVPELLKELGELRAKGRANPEVADKTEKELLPSRPAREWRVIRLESNLEPLAAPPQKGGPGGPGGP